MPFAVYKRPFCDDFLRFCFDRFHVGIWSSRAKYLLTSVFDFILFLVFISLTWVYDVIMCWFICISEFRLYTFILTILDARVYWQV